MPDSPHHRTPGHLIQDLLDKREWTQRVLATVIGSDESTVNKIIAGKRPLEAEMALALADVFDVPAERFMDLQKSYELAQARVMARPDPGRANRALLFGKLPVADMIKRGWLDATDPRNVPSVEAALAKFFGTASADEIPILPHAAKKTDEFGEVTPVQLAWLYRVKEIAGELLVSRYTPDALDAAIAKLGVLRGTPDDVRKVPRILQDAGIRFLLVESLPGSKIDGVCFWIGDSPVVAMSMRYDRIDNFWFVLRHELEHVRRQDGRVKMMLDAELEGERAGIGPNVPEEERAANLAAAEFCVPQISLKQFVDRKAPFFAERDIIGFARTLKIHPGLIAGQLQRRIDRYDRFRQHLAKIRSLIVPSAAHDGWGDVYPVGI